jgi:hypothetical protein
MEKWLKFVLLMILLVVPMMLFLPHLQLQNYMPSYMNDFLGFLFIFYLLIIVYLMLKNA